MMPPPPPPLLLLLLLLLLSPSLAVDGGGTGPTGAGCAPASCSLCSGSEAKCVGNQCQWNATSATCHNPRVCPCDDPALCRPLSPQPPHGRQEVFAFVSAPATENISQWRTWPWDKITTLASFECLGPGTARENQCREKGRVYRPGQPAHGVGQEMYCMAHKHGARVLSWGYGGVYGVHCPIGEYYKWWTEKDARTHNSSAVQDWAQRSAECVAAQGYDGILLDMETLAPPFVAPAEKPLITAAVCELREALNVSIPGGMLSWTTDTGKYFEYDKMTARRCVDLWLDMDYSRWCVRIR